VIPGIESLNLAGKRVFLRVDFNVPFDAEGRVADDSRIRASLPTIQYVLEKGGKAILASHLGRPEGQVQPKYSLLPVAERLSELLAQEVFFPEDCIGNAARKLVGEMREGQTLLLENLRFHPGEEANDPIFSERLAAFADVYVNDAFGTLHRAHASTVGMVPLVPSRAAGKLVMKEIAFLGKLLQEPERPFLVMLGGAKVSDKVGVIENLLRKADPFLIGGAMAYTFLKAQGVGIGSSLVEEAKVRQAGKILDRAKNKDISIHLPLDHVVVQKLEAGAAFQTTPGPEIPSGWMGVDIGPKTSELFAEKIGSARTVFWNGPLGAFEFPPFDAGTIEAARAVAAVSGMKIIGGGDSLLAVQRAGVAERMTHLSTGGGASLEFLEGKTLPGLKALVVEE
jgi:phosphoglycerate kinase